MRSTGVAAHRSLGVWRKESVGSTTCTSAPIPSTPLRAAWAVTVTARLGDCAWTPGASPHDSDSAHPAT